MSKFKQRQRGATLLVGLVMLVLITLLAVSSFNLGKSNLQIVGNMQHRTENMEAAKATLEEVISKTTFSTSPGATLTSCGTNAKCFDVNGDGASDITVTLTPAPCIKKYQIIKNSQLDTDKPEEAKCAMGDKQDWNPEGANTDDSLCAATVWEITALATDNVTQASYTVAQGVTVPIVATAAVGSNLCP